MSQLYLKANPNHIIFLFLRNIDEESARKKWYFVTICNFSVVEQGQGHQLEKLFLFKNNGDEEYFLNETIALPSIFGIMSATVPFHLQ